MLVHCRHVPKHVCVHLEPLTCTPQEDPGPPAGTTGWEGLLSLKEEPDPTRAHLPARRSQHVTTNNALSSTCCVPGTVPVLACHTLFDRHTNPMVLGWYPVYQVRSQGRKMLTNSHAATCLGSSPEGCEAGSAPPGVVRRHPPTGEHGISCTPVTIFAWQAHYPLLLFT